MSQRRELRNILYHNVGDFLSADPQLDSYEVCHMRSKNRGGVIRINHDCAEPSLVVKIWNLRNTKELLKSYLLMSNGYKEWNIHKFIYSRGTNVPKPYGFFRIKFPSGFYEIMPIEDLGITEKALPLIKRISLHKSKSELHALENRLIEATSELINMNIVDIDHQLNNFLINANNELIRIDFECAKKFTPTSPPRDQLSEMFARLITSHIYAVQPNLSLAVNFASRLYEKLSIDTETRLLIQASVNEKLEKQYATNGVNTVINLPG